MKKRMQATIFGLVQGVGFRYYCREEALNLGLTGYARNIFGGREVEVVVEGEEPGLKKFSDWLHRGPPSAKVEKARISTGEYKGEFSDFKLL
jgi:acylphosphatase